MRSERYRLTGGVLLLVLSLSEARAGADGAEKAQAQKLFDDGTALLKDGKYSEACPKLEESYRLDAAPGALMNLAACQEGLGHWATAHGLYGDALAIAVKTKNAKREKTARDRLQALEQKLSHVTIVVPQPTRVPGLEISWDGKPAGEGRWGVALPVDPGSHQIAASAPGYQKWSITIEVAPDASSRTVEVPVLKRSVDPSPVATAPPPLPTPAQPTPTASTAKASSNAMPFVTMGVGALVVGVGGYFGFSARSKNEESHRAGMCDGNRCSEEGRALRESAAARADTATICFAAGSALVVGGIVWWALTPAQSATVTKVGVGPTGISVEGRF